MTVTYVLEMLVYSNKKNNQTTKLKAPTLKLWFRKKKKRKLNQIFPLFRRWSQPPQPSNSNGCSPEMGWWHQNWSQHFSAPQTGHSLPFQAGLEELCPHPAAGQVMGTALGSPWSSLPAQGGLELPLLNSTEHVWSWAGRKAGKDYPSVKQPLFYTASHPGV